MVHLKCPVVLDTRLLGTRRQLTSLWRLSQVRHSRDAFLVLTTDGVNISLTDQEIVDIINGRTDPEEAAKQVTDQALQFGSEDNATAVVMPFGAWGKYSRAVSTIQYDFGRNIIGPRYS